MEHQVNFELNKWLKMAGIVKEDVDLHVFDFDDTLGVTTSPTLVAAVEYNGGDPDDPESYVPVKDLLSRVGSVVKGVKLPPEADVKSSGLKGDRVKSEDELNDSQAIVLDTEQYRDWKEKYIPSGDHVRLVINPNIDRQIRDAGRKMKQAGKTGEIHVADFSPSSTIGSSVKPIKQMLKTLAKAEAAGDETAVVTARKGATDLDALGGGKVPATNAADISAFVSGETGARPDEVLGAADFNPTDPASAKRDLIIKLASKPGIENIFFYDDDPENARRVAQICDDAPELTGKELDIYNYEFAKGAKPTKPTFSCTIGEGKMKKKITESQLRKGIRSLIREVEINSDDAAPEWDLYDYENDSADLGDAEFYAKYDDEWDELEASDRVWRNPSDTPDAWQTEEEYLEDLPESRIRSVLRKIVRETYQGAKSKPTKQAWGKPTPSEKKVEKKRDREAGKKATGDLEEAETRDYKGQEYKSSAGSISALKKHGWSVEKAVKAGDFDWADDPYAAAQAALIVGRGETTRSASHKRKD
jgi:hypothetical protein